MWERPVQADPYHYHILHTVNTAFLQVCVPHNFITIIMCADDVTVLGLITSGDKTAYRKEVTTLTSWWQDNNLQIRRGESGLQEAAWWSTHPDHILGLITSSQKQQESSASLFVEFIFICRITYMDSGIHLLLVPPSSCITTWNSSCVALISRTKLPSMEELDVHHCRKRVNQIIIHPHHLKNRRPAAAIL